jgi:hypothetical protein
MKVTEIQIDGAVFDGDGNPADGTALVSVQEVDGVECAIIGAADLQKVRLQDKGDLGVSPRVEGDWRTLMDAEDVRLAIPLAVLRGVVGDG